MHTIDDIPLEGKTVLCRVDINSPIDREHGTLKDTTRLERCAPTIVELSKKGARVVLLAHQGGDLEYQNYASTKPHADELSQLTGLKVEFIDDVCGPAARERIRKLEHGEVLLLDNVRFMAEEMTLFETKLKLAPEEQADTLVVRKLAPLGDVYVCDAFAAAHRSQPTLVGFEEVLPSAMGRLFEREVEALSRVRATPDRPCVYVLGGAKIQDAFMMMSSVLSDGTADTILTCGLLSNIMLIAKGIDLGVPSRKFISEHGLDDFIEPAREVLDGYGNHVGLPVDLAYVNNGERCEVDVDRLPAGDLLVDIGSKTVELYRERISHAKTVFMNGPAGVFEQSQSEYGTKSIIRAIVDSDAFTVMGGGDSISAANKFGLSKHFSYVSTAGGGLVRFLSGEELPVINALKRSAERYTMPDLG